MKAHENLTDSLENAVLENATISKDEITTAPILPSSISEKDESDDVSDVTTDSIDETTKSYALNVADRIWSSVKTDIDSVLSDSWNRTTISDSEDISADDELDYATPDETIPDINYTKTKSRSASAEFFVSFSQGINYNEYDDNTDNDIDDDIDDEIVCSIHHEDHQPTTRSNNVTHYADVLAGKLLESAVDSSIKEISKLSKEIPVPNNNTILNTTAGYISDAHQDSFILSADPITMEENIILNVSKTDTIMPTSDDKSFLTEIKPSERQLSLDTIYNNDSISQSRIQPTRSPNAKN
ncbi:unnamed protein product [Adineta steineri]|nr:unnamed protein product [Adineta steineri]